MTDGPFADWKINLGPVAGNHACTDNPQDDGLGLNTRCLERKFEPKFLGNLTYDNVTFTINDFEGERFVVTEPAPDLTAL